MHIQPYTRIYVYYKRMIISLFFSCLLSNFNVQCMYEGPDLQLCQFLSAINNGHEFYMPCEYKGTSDLQIYQFLKAIINNFQLKMFLDSTPIMIKVCAITQKLHMPCYEAVYAYDSIPDVIINFIKDSLKKSRSHASIVNILKISLPVSGKSLSEIKDRFDKNIFHHLFFKTIQRRGGGVTGASAWRTSKKENRAKILCLLAEKHAWDLIIKEHNYTENALYWACQAFNVCIVNELLRTAPCQEEAWKAICAPSNRKHMLLNEIIKNESTPRPTDRNPFNASVLIIQQLLSSAPNHQEAWELINTPDPEKGETALHIAIKERDQNLELINLRLAHIGRFHTYRYYNFVAIVKILESYNPNK